MANESFTAEEESFEATTAKTRKNGDVVSQGVFEGDDESGINDVVVLDVDFEDRTVGVEEDVAVSGGFKQYETFAAEETFCALPATGDIDTFAVCHIGSSLQEEGPAGEVIVLGITHVTWGEEDFAGAVIRGEGVHDEAFSSKHSTEGLEGSPFESGFEFEVGAHRGHCRGFRVDLLSLF